MISASELSRLWKKHAPGLLFLARMRCQSAEDCVQIAFIRMSTLSTIPDDPVAWLARVVRNESISSLRSETRRQRREQSFSETKKNWFVPDEEEHDLAPEEIEAALRKLETESREILVAHLWNNLSFRQIAEVFDISSSSAHRKYLQAVNEMRTLLGVSLDSE